MHKLRYVWSAATAVLLVSSCVSPSKTDIPPPANPGFGESKAAAVEVCQPAGEQAYLARLVCPDGKIVRFDRLGGYGPRNVLPADLPLSEQLASARRDPLKPGDVDYHVIDGYELTCADTRRIVYLDMYHCHQPLPQQAPPGLSLR